MKFSLKQIKKIISDEIIKEINTSGIDVRLSGMNMRRGRIGSRSKAKDSLKRIEDDLDDAFSAIERVEEYTRHIHRMLKQIVTKNKKKK
jgi:uncharacterized protein YqgV (UPF0045/DUF77 family)|tara:strand:- start:874 stop:1140 length:267 start_codon:yes stop_codon:yes gene_type:complete